MPSWDEFQPFIVTGLALGGVYALSGVGMVVLYRTTGVLNLAFGAVGAMGALIAWQPINKGAGRRSPPTSSACCSAARSRCSTGCSSARRWRAGTRSSKPTATLGLALILLGTMSWIWSDKARSMILPTSTENFMVSDVLVNYTQVIGLAFGVVVTIGHGAVPAASRSSAPLCARLANDREITATLGVPVRRVEAPAWLVSGLLAGVAGLLLSNLVGLDATTLTFLVISSLAAALIARLSSLVVTLVAGHRRRPRDRAGHADPVHLRVPGHGAVRARDPGAAVALAPPRATPSRGGPSRRERRRGARPRRARLVAGPAGPRRAHPRGRDRGAARPRAARAAGAAQRLLDQRAHAGGDLLGRVARARAADGPGRPGLARADRRARARGVGRRAPVLRDRRCRSRSCCC